MSLSFDPDEGMTHQSFKDECDINNIIDQFGRSGVVSHLASVKPQYGEVPDIDFHEAMCAHAALATHEAESPEADSEAAEKPQEASPDGQEGEPEKPPEAAEKPANVEQSG